MALDSVMKSNTLIRFKIISGLNISITGQQKNVKTIGAYTESTDLILKGLSHEIDFRKLDKNLQNLA